ncbi:hypothetical protein BJY52DRAFT_843004 [Lactarius psammicola]|nr:hypothetical protein BJY52DRAFT_843004 [Lactarius psammicola]
MKVNTASTFCLSPLGNGSDSATMTLYFCLDIHSYSDDVAVPFFRSPSDELIALQTKGYWDDITLTMRSRRVLLIPIVSLTSHIDGATADNVPMRYIPWNDWGATGTRWAPGRGILRHFHGSGSLSSSRSIPELWATKFVDVWDFSRARVAQLEPQQCDREFLPCVRTQVALPIQMTRFDTVVISEDALIYRHWFKSGAYLFVF